MTLTEIQTQYFPLIKRWFTTTLREPCSTASETHPTKEDREGGGSCGQLPTRSGVESTVEESTEGTGVRLTDEESTDTRMSQNKEDVCPVGTPLFGPHVLPVVVLST